MVLHTFGRDLKWNPHIHCLISEGGYSYDDVFVTFHYNRHEDEKYVEETLPVNRQPLICHARLCAGSFYQEFDECRTFLLYKKKKPLTRYLLTHQQLLSCFVSVYYSVLQRFICFQHSP